MSWWDDLIRFKNNVVQDARRVPENLRKVPQSFSEAVRKNNEDTSIASYPGKIADQTVGSVYRYGKGIIADLPATLGTQNEVANIQAQIEANNRYSNARLQAKIASPTTDPRKRAIMQQELNRPSFNAYEETYRGNDLINDPRRFAQDTVNTASMVLPGAKVPMAGKLASTPLRRFATASVIRGAEGAGWQGASNLVQGRPVTENMGTAALFGVGANAVLSPRLVAQSVRQGARAVAKPIAGALRGAGSKLAEVADDSRYLAHLEARGAKLRQDTGLKDRFGNPIAIDKNGIVPNNNLIQTDLGDMAPTTYYHIASPENAAKIRQQGLLPNPEGYVNLATPEGYQRLTTKYPDQFPQGHSVFKVTPGSLDSFAGDQAAVRGGIHPSQLKEIGGVGSPEVKAEMEAQGRRSNGQFDFKNKDNTKYRLADNDPLMSEARKYKSAEEFKNNYDGGAILDRNKVNDWISGGPDNTAMASELLGEEGKKFMKKMGLPDIPVRVQEAGEDTIGHSAQIEWRGGNRLKDARINIEISPTEEFGVENLAGKESDLLHELAHAKQITLNRLGNKKIQSEISETSAQKNADFHYNKALEDIYNQANSKFRTTPTASGLPDADLSAIDKKFFGKHANTQVTSQILTPEGQQALGSYRDGIIRIVQGQGNPADTLHHEAVHKAFDLFTDRAEQVDLLKAAEKHYGLSDLNQVEERMAEDFISYAKTRQGVTGQLKAHFDRILERVKSYFGNEDAIKKFYADLQTGSKAKSKVSEAIDTNVDSAFSPYNSSKQPKDDNLLLKARETLQDRMIRQKKLQQNANVADGANPYQAEELFHGRVASRIEDTKAEFEGLFRKMNDYAKQGGIEFNKLRGAVNKYLQATHAPERNLQHGAGAAGMTDKQAKAILDEISASPHNQAVTEFAGELRKMSDRTLDILREGGVLSQKQVDTLRATYENHVPLQRIMDDDVFSALSGKGYDVKSTGVLRAKGSEREVDDIAGNIMANLEQAIVRSEKNRYGLNVLEFARNNKDLGFEVKAPSFIGETTDGRILTDKNLPENALSVFEDGKQKIIVISDPKLAAALKGVSVEQVPALLRPIAATTRFLSSMATRYNPEFVLSNIVRDSQELAVYIASQADMPKGSVSAVTKQIAPSLNDVRMYLKGDLSSEGARLYQQMIKDGGTTGGMGLSTRGQVQLDISQIEKLVQSKPRRAARKVVETIDGWNQMFEDATRLAAYKQAIKSGLSRERAASIAKNATINFNRKGTAGTLVNSLYMFSNASIQGSTKVLTSMKNPKVAAATIAAVSGPVWAVNSYNDAVDPDWRDKVADWDRQSNLVIMLPSKEGSKYITVPVSWGLKPIKVIADQSYDIATGKAGDGLDVASKIVTAFTEAYNPAGGTDLVSAVTPSILDTPVDIARNQKWSGTKIRSDKELVANHQNYFGSLSNSLFGKSSIYATEKLADATGNRIDINPADMAYAVEQYVGGAGRSLERFGTTAVNTVQGKPTDVKDVPFANRFIKTQDQEQVEKNLTYKDKDDFEKKLKRMKAGSDEQREFIQEYLWNQPKEDRQGIMYGLQLKGVYTKGLTIKDKNVAIADREQEAAGQKFLQSGQSLQVVGDKVFRADNSEKGYSVQPKIQYDADVMETKKTRLKKNNDFKGWMDNAEKLYTNYEEQLKDPKLDELEKMKIQGKMEDLLAEGQKYAGYGGKFTKGKKAKLSGSSTPNITLKAAKPQSRAIAAVKSLPMPKLKAAMPGRKSARVRLRVK